MWTSWELQIRRPMKEQTYINFGIEHIQSLRRNKNFDTLKLIENLHYIDLKSLVDPFCDFMLQVSK
jgi:hypothetical protein